jgi:hypothetical protein
VICALTAQWLNTIGLVLGMVGVVILFIWGPPQPDFIEGDVYVASDNTEIAARVKRLKRWHTGMSRIGLVLIGVGFGAQLLAVWR